MSPLPSLLQNVRHLFAMMRASGGSVDLRDLKWIYPLELLPLAALITEQNLPYQLPADEKCRGYLEYFHFPYGLTKYQRPSNNYMPIYQFPTGRDQQGLLVQSHIIGSLTNVIVQRIGAQSGVWDGLSTAIDEVVSNIQQHADSKAGWICAQHYPNKGYLDVCLLDTGISIPGSYRKHDIDIGNDVDAIQSAVRGLSVKNEEGIRGAGLRTIINMIRGFGGQVVLLSGAALLHATPSAKLYPSSVTWHGTVLGLRIPEQTKPFNYTQYLEGSVF